MNDHLQPSDKPTSATQNQKPKAQVGPKNETDPKADSVVDKFMVKVGELEVKLKAAHESHLRTQADYQNLQRRTQEEKQQWIKLATKEFASSLLEPLDHLGLAAAQLNDQGLNMTLNQLWERLREQGLEEIDPLGKPFDVSTMDAVDRQGDGEVVLSVVKKGYVLNGEVIQHAKVIVGSPKENN